MYVTYLLLAGAEKVVNRIRPQGDRRRDPNCGILRIDNGHGADLSWRGGCFSHVCSQGQPASMNWNHQWFEDLASQVGHCLLVLLLSNDMELCLKEQPDEIANPNSGTSRSRNGAPHGGPGKQYPVAQVGPLLERAPVGYCAR